VVVPARGLTDGVDPLLLDLRLWTPLTVKCRLPQHYLDMA
jgi:hypothetical protein